MILSEADYNTMWNIDFGMAGAPPPAYHEYLQREVYKQDYFDLFGTGRTITYPRRFKSGRWYVTILGITLEVEYDYPFPTALKGASKVREIKYVLIGEAPYVGSTFFYNCLHSSTAYINAPLIAFGGALTLTKPEKLIYLANEGVVLFDLFPFSIGFSSTLRRRVNPLAVPQFNLVLASLLLAIPVEYSFLCTPAHARLIITAHAALGIGSKTATTWIAWGAYPHVLLNPALTKRRRDLNPPIGGFRSISEFKSIGKDGYGNPHQIPIRFGFNLP